MQFGKKNSKHLCKLEIYNKVVSYRQTIHSNSVLSEIIQNSPLHYKNSPMTDPKMGVTHTFELM